MALGKDNSLFNKMVDSIKNLGTQQAREEAVAKVRAEEKLSREVKVLAPLHELIVKQMIEVKKLEKPPIGFDADDKEVERLRTKEEFEALKKAREKLDKMRKAYEKGMESGDISDAHNLVQQSGSKDKGDKTGESAKETD